MNKKGLGLKGYLLALLLFTGLISGFFQVVTQQGGFWKSYNYTPSTAEMNTMGNYSQLSTFTEMQQTLQCDINPEPETCKNVKKNPLSSTPIGQMVLGGYDVFITILKSIWMPQIMLEHVATSLGIPPIIITIFRTAIILMLILSIAYLIFNRSDST